jgi:hypothetical protein
MNSGLFGKGSCQNLPQVKTATRHRNYVAFISFRSEPLNNMAKGRPVEHVVHAFAASGWRDHALFLLGKGVDDFFMTSKGRKRIPVVEWSLGEAGAMRRHELLQKGDFDMLTRKCSCFEAIQ